MNRMSRHKRNTAIIILLLVIAIGTGLYYLASKTSLVKTNTPQASISPPEPDQQDFDDASFEGDGKWYGLCKKNSVRTIADFHQTVSNDPVLKAHYAGFKWENAKVGSLDKATWAYVYYRKNDTIFRKKKPILLPAGDQYITDGMTSVRMHCCNSYATTPPSDLDATPSAGPPMIEKAGIPPLQDLIAVSAPPSPDEPPITIEPPPVSEKPPLSPPPPLYPPVHPPSVCVNPCAPDDKDCENPCEPPPTPPPTVPEPHTIFLLGIGVIYFFILPFVRRKKNTHNG